MTHLNDAHIFLLAGEPSGDVYGGSLQSVLRQRYPQIRLSGVGGPSMRAAGLQPIIPMEELQVMGFSQVFASLPRIIKQFRMVKDHIIEKEPDVTVLIDYPDFNLRLAKALRRNGFTKKIVQLVSPTVWAWRQSRIAIIEENFDMLLTIFPFEKQYFSNAVLDVQYIGHPLIDKIEAYRYDDQWHNNYGLSKEQDLVALFPGSRKAEILANLPNMLAIVKNLQQKWPQVQFAISIACEKFFPLLSTILQEHLPGHHLPLIATQHSYELMRDSKTAMATSGTVTLELALHKTPTLVVYQASAFNYFVAMYIIRPTLKHFCIVNILAGEEVFPEIIGVRFSPERASQHLQELHTDAAVRSNIIDSCGHIMDMLNTTNTMHHATNAIEDIIDA